MRVGQRPVVVLPLATRTAPTVEREQQAVPFGPTPPTAVGVASAQKQLNKGVLGLARKVMALAGKDVEPKDPGFAQLCKEAGIDKRDRIEAIGVEAGDGHKMIMDALLDGLAKDPIGSTHKVLGHDEAVVFNQHLDPLGNFLFEKSYIFMAQKMPRVWDFVYSRMPEIMSARATRAQLRSTFITPALVQAIRDNGSKTIICPHPIMSQIVDVMKRDGQLSPDVKVINVITDYAATKAYASPGLTIVPHESLKEQLVAMGKDPDMIRVVSGIPARPAFRAPYDPAAARAQLDTALSKKEGKPNVLGEGRPTILAVGGGDGIKLPELVDFLPHWKPSTPVNLVMVCGRDSAGLIPRIEGLKREGKLHENITLIAEGYINATHEPPMDVYWKAADLIVSKPGGSSTAEAFALGKPLAAHAYIEGQEKKNYDLMTKLGVILPLELKQLDDVPAVLARGEAVKAAIKREFPRTAEIPQELAGIIRDYVEGRIEESASERRALALAIKEKEHLHRRVRLSRR